MLWLVVVRFDKATGTHTHTPHTYSFVGFGFTWTGAVRCGAAAHFKEIITIKHMCGVDLMFGDGVEAVGLCIEYIRHMCCIVAQSKWKSLVCVRTYIHIYIWRFSATAAHSIDKVKCAVYSWCSAADIQLPSPQWLIFWCVPIRFTQFIAFASSMRWRCLLIDELSWNNRIYRRNIIRIIIYIVYMWIVFADDFQLRICILN